MRNWFHTNSSHTLTVQRWVVAQVLQLIHCYTHPPKFTNDLIRGLRARRRKTGLTGTVGVGLNGFWQVWTRPRVAGISRGQRSRMQGVSPTCSHGRRSQGAGGGPGSLFDSLSSSAALFTVYRGKRKLSFASAAAQPTGSFNQRVLSKEDWGQVKRVMSD